MREVVGDLFTYNPTPNNIEKTPDSVEELLAFRASHGNILRCVTTNAVIKPSGYLVMGAGIAKKAARRFPELPYLFAQKIDERGNHVHIIEKYGICSFPTKHHWKDPSDINLILRSCRELVCFTKKWDYVLLPRPGCNNGGLEWDTVRAVIEPLLHNDKFIIVHSYN